MSWRFIKKLSLEELHEMCWDPKNVGKEIFLSESVSERLINLNLKRFWIRSFTSKEIKSLTIGENRVYRSMVILDEKNEDYSSIDCIRGKIVGPGDMQYVIDIPLIWIEEIK